MKSSIFWDITPCSPLNVNRHFGGTYRLLTTSFTLVTCLAYSSTLKMEATCSSETSVDIRLTTWREIPDDITLQSKPLVTKHDTEHSPEPVACTSHPYNKFLYDPNGRSSSSFPTTFLYDLFVFPVRVRSTRPGKFKYLNVRTL
jgi:hypothetical protein